MNPGEKETLKKSLLSVDDTKYPTERLTPPPALQLFQKGFYAATFFLENF